MHAVQARLAPPWYHGRFYEFGLEERVVFQIDGSIISYFAQLVACPWGVSHVGYYAGMGVGGSGSGDLVDQKEHTIRLRRAAADAAAYPIEARLNAYYRMLTGRPQSYGGVSCESTHGSPALVGLGGAP